MFPEEKVSQAQAFFSHTRAKVSTLGWKAVERNLNSVESGLFPQSLNSELGLLSSLMTAALNFTQPSI